MFGKKTLFMFIKFHQIQFSPPPLSVIHILPMNAKTVKIKFKWIIKKY